MFETSRRFLLLEYFRVPHHVKASDARWPSVGRHGRSLTWVPADELSGPLRELRLGPRPLFARVLADDEARGSLPCDDRWRPLMPIRDAAGARVGSVWGGNDGSVFLPFDPDEAITAMWSEAYTQLGRARFATAASKLARRSYYRVRPLLPRAGQIGLRRAFSRVQSRAAFPRWPDETALHDLYSFLFGLLRTIAAEPVPTIAPWPRGSSWALVLTHDVETTAGYQALARVRSLEQSLGYRSSWNFVPLRDYRVDDALVADLQSDGFEVGVHGLHHDGRDFASRATFVRRHKVMRQFAERWGAVGFRSPATHRVWEWMPQLGFEYDSSYTDTALYEPQPGGCCTWLPFHIGDLVELPITLPQDHTLFEILGHTDEQLWVDKATLLQQRGGLALVLTHPDYMIEGPVLPAYERFLERYAAAEGVWRALPREVNSWWRRRAASRIERVGDRWSVVGPAAGDGAIELVDEAVEVLAA